LFRSHFGRKIFNFQIVQIFSFGLANSDATNWFQAVYFYCIQWRKVLTWSSQVIFIMANAGKESSTASDLLKNSSLYREFQAEREEILRHKWIESEKAGRDIGFEQALTDWISRHRSSWRKNRQAAATN
jgi:hypothetical protein